MHRMTRPVFPTIQPESRVCQRLSSFKLEQHGQVKCCCGYNLVFVFFPSQYEHYLDVITSDVQNVICPPAASQLSVPTTVYRGNMNFSVIFRNVD